ncbi:histidine kinase dimerization/phospho-acceptor domain-containing protein [Granulicella cerasi]|uniref:histidine kinase n=1 Tax=Granulicella cerasi TaxID=741063 RepID=A0ABW1ZFE2_9BACT|nr:histidine kinase dimerization/phospho-acceptor domain-containing protein [Granulicella cerasi]
MSATIAHEVNNPLEAILNLGFLLSEHPTLDDEARNYTRLLIDEVMRVSEITKQTLSYYRDTSHEERVDLGEALDGVLRLHRPLIRQRAVEVTTEYWGSASFGRER